MMSGDGYLITIHFKVGILLSIRSRLLFEIYNENIVVIT
jgi:hypothetical protein